MKILILGVNGFIGNALTKKILETIKDFIKNEENLWRVSTL